MTLRTKTTISFCAAFVLIGASIYLFLFGWFRNILLNSFDDGLRSKAALVLSKTSIQPRIVPLPENNDLFLIVYHTNSSTDTLYRPVQLPFALPSVKDSVATSNNWRMVRLQQASDNGGNLEVLYAAPAYSLQQQIQHLILLLWLALAAGATISGMIAWYFSSRLLRPLRQVIRQANTVNLYQNTMPLPLSAGETEGQELVASINRMLGRIQEQAERQTAFFAAASHELRTPLSVMQTHLQVMLQTTQASDPLYDVYSSQLQEVQKLSKMVNDFLLMSQLQTSRPEVKIVSIDLVELLTLLVEKKGTKAAQRNNRFRLAFLPAEADFEMNADYEKMEIIFNNLLDNTVKYAADGTLIQLTVQKEASRFSIQISNTIREDIQPEPVDIKNAFYQSKPLHGEGFGLGLWIVNQLASLQNIDLYCSISKERIFTATLSMDED